MPFRNRNLHMLKNWEPDTSFDPASDRLLVTTDWGDTFVAYWHRSDAAQMGHLAIDMDFPMENLQEIPELLKLYHDFHTSEGWYVFIYDGELTESGPRLDIIAAGDAWSWSISTSLGIADIKPVQLSELDQYEVSASLGGIYLRSEQVRITSREYDKLRSAVAA